MLNLARLKISEKQVERVTERIGQERVEQREKQVQAFLALPMMEKFATPVAHPPDLAVVSMDGGRLQIRDWPSSDAALGGVASPVAAAEPPSITAGRRCGQPSRRGGGGGRGRASRGQHRERSPRWRPGQPGQHQERSPRWRPGQPGRSRPGPRSEVVTGGKIRLVC